MNSAFTGKEFFSLPIERQIELLKHGNKVFCRTEPSDKQRLITMLGTHSPTHLLTYSLTYSPTHSLT
jgi:magnesium-transporting ATPase (P-type)